jgi:hypothetical protein
MALVVVFALARIAFEMIGASTAPDDFALLQERMPAVTDWLFSTPWWVPTILLVAMCGAGAWLIWSGTRKTAADEISGRIDGLTKEEIEVIVSEYLSNQPKPIPPPSVDLENFLASRLRAEFMTQAQGDEWHQKLSKAQENANAATAVGRLAFDFAKEQSADLSKELKRIDNDRSELDSRMTEWVRVHCESQERRFRWIDLGFAAIHNLEWLRRLYTELIEEGEKLKIPIAQGGRIAEWSEWDMAERYWSGKLDEWIVIAAYYAPGCVDVRTIPESMYYGRWSFSDDQFESADHVRRYKEFAIRLHSLSEFQPRAQQAIIVAAFHAPSMKGRDDAPPRPA